MHTLFSEFNATINNYKNASLTDRESHLRQIVKCINALPETPVTLEEASNITEHLAFSSQVIIFNNNLRKIEGQAFFEVLGDYNQMSKFFANANALITDETSPRYGVVDDQYIELKNYFDFNGKFQMKLTKPHTEIPQRIWALFHKAQQHYLADQGKNWNIQEFDFRHLPPEQLYPLPQMLGAYDNQAVDRVCMNSKGQFTMAEGPAGIQCPGGGMIEVDLQNTFDLKMRKMLDEYLEEENGSLYLTAADYYNQLTTDAFLETLKNCINASTRINGENIGKFAQLTDFSTLKTSFYAILDNARSNDNASLLKELMALLKSHPLKGDVTSQKNQQKLLNELKAMIQVETFKLHPVYEEAFDFIKAHSTQESIDQVNDIRRGGGLQTSHTFVMNQPLDVFFKQKNIENNQLADDMTGSKYVRFTLLELLAQFDKVRFSHILTVLAGQLKSIEANNVTLDTIWNQEQFKTAKKFLVQKAKEAILALPLDEKVHQNRLEYLKNNFKDTPKEVQERLANLVREAEMLEKKGCEANIESARKAIRDTVLLMDNIMSVEEYKACSNKIKQGKASIFMNILGGLMLALCLTAIAFGILIAVTPGLGVAVGLALTLPLTISTGLNSGMLLFSGREKGLSKATSQLAEKEIPPMTPASFA